MKLESTTTVFYLELYHQPIRLIDPAGFTSKRAVPDLN